MVEQMVWARCNACGVMQEYAGIHQNTRCPTCKSQEINWPTQTQPSQQKTLGQVAYEAFALAASSKWRVWGKTTSTTKKHWQAAAEAAVEAVIASTPTNVELPSKWFSQAVISSDMSAMTVMGPVDTSKLPNGLDVRVIDGNNLQSNHSKPPNQS